MPDTLSSHSNLSLAPLGPGDLIDRAIRLYRMNFATAVLIAAPPVVAGALVSFLWRTVVTLLMGNEIRSEGDTVIYWFLVSAGGMVIWAVELTLVLAVMGGSSLNFIRNILLGEEISFAQTYRNTKARFFPLIGASALMVAVAGGVGVGIFYLGLILGGIGAVFAATVLAAVPVLAFLVGSAIALGALFLTGWLFFFIASKIAFIPQVMLVEGSGLGQAFTRSASLGKGGAKRLAALFIFTIIASYSALALLYVPLGWYAWISGTEWMTFGSTTVPFWYEVAGQIVGQASLLIAIPVLMIGLCLLYVDERVRNEGYDIELMAASRLPEVPGTDSAARW